MTDISCKSYLQNNVTCTYRINLKRAIIRHQKLLLTRRELPTVALSYHVKKQRELLKSRKVVKINRYESFMGKGILRLQTLQKGYIEPHQNFTGSYKKNVKALD